MNEYKDIKMFFFDNDSTLFDHSVGKVREKTMEALRQLKANGYKLCLNTSRSYEESYNIPKELMDMMDAHIMLGGAYIIKDGEVHCKYLNQDRVNKAIEYLNSENITYRYCLDNGGGYLNHKDPVKEAFFYQLYEMTPPIKKYEGERIVHLLSYPSQQQGDELVKIFNQEENARLRIAIETSPAGCNKGHAMLEVAKMYGYTSENCCGVGDSNNDIDMIRFAKLGIAMGNSQEGVKQYADYVTDDISDEGIYNAMKHFNFI